MLVVSVTTTPDAVPVLGEPAIPTCDGEGVIPCRFCGGTGFLMLGQDLIGTNNDCPVCKGSGHEECKECMGAGSIALWRDIHK